MFIRLVFIAVLSMFCSALPAQAAAPPLQGEGFVCELKLSGPQPNGSGDFGYIYLKVSAQPHCMGGLVAYGNIYTEHATWGQPWEHHSEAGLMAMHQTLYMALRDGTRIEYFYYPEAGTGLAPHFGGMNFAGR